MEQDCHRCGAALNGSDPFCAHCGAPQLRYEAPDETAPVANAAPAQRPGGRNLNTISSRDAIVAAAIFAVPAGVLCALLGLVALWGVAGGMATISLYRRRTAAVPAAGMSWRIGALFGLFTAAVATAVNGIGLLVQRFALHQGAVLDQRYHGLGQQLMDQMVRSNPEAATLLPGFLHFWLTPDGAAAMVLINAAGVAVSVLLLAAAGGALGARLNARIAHSSAR
jgi:hypothetical protein